MIRAALDSAASVRWPRPESLGLMAAIVAEPIPGDLGLVLWRRGARAGGYRCWERIAAVPHTEFTVEPGIWTAAATAVEAQQPAGLSGWLPRPRQPPGRSWTLPGGGAAHASDDPHTDLLLVWADSSTIPLDEAWVQSRWPGNASNQRLGRNLFLVRGVRLPTSPAATNGGCPREPAQQALAAARVVGDRQAESTALIDLGLMDLNEGDPATAAVRLTEALSLARSVQDREREVDALAGLGRAALLAGRPREAVVHLEPARAGAHAAGDRHAEKAAWEMLGFAQANLGDAAAAHDAFTAALALARSVGDRVHEAELLWHLGVQDAALGRSTEALAHTTEAVTLLEAEGQPSAAVFADYLRQYRDAAHARVDDTAAAALGGLGGSVVVCAEAVPTGPAIGPGLLRQAVSAAAAAARYLATGLRTVPPVVLGRRLRTCAACAHHTGLRCRLCGCFTNAKARLPHERCPAGKWTD